jgi:DNA repair protein RadC
MSIRDWLRNERPREKLIERSAPVLSEAELLAVLIGSGVRGRGAISLSRLLSIPRLGAEHPTLGLASTSLNNN